MIAAPGVSNARTPRWRGYLAVGAIWVSLVAAFTVQEFFARRWGGGPISWQSLLLSQVINWTTWILLTWLVVLPLCKAFPLRGEATLRHTLIHAAFGSVVVVLQSIVVAAIFASYYFGFAPLAIRDVFRDRLNMSLAINALTYVAILTSVHALWMTYDSERRRSEAATLEAAAVRAELNALYAQLQPHFLFNAFNSIAELVHSDPPRATGMIRALSDLLRRSLHSAGDVTTTLAEELEFLRRYVALQEMRFSRLHVEFHVPQETLEARVPPLVLQPLMENAIRYTVGNTGLGSVRVSSERRGNRLLLVVEDNGRGFEDAPRGKDGSGVGLANTRARLDRVYPGDYALDLSKSGSGGAQVVLTLPFVPT